MRNDKKTELLAPAGSVRALKAVIEAGADAVYIGGTRFGARAYAENPEEEDLTDAIDYAHLRGIRVYLTVNTLLKDREIDELADFIRPYYEHGIDAVLVQDFGVLKILHECFPDLPLHASTQMTVTGPCSARMLGEYGVTRIVPARELSLKELRELRDGSGLEVEAFVHGAICVCYSGQCLMSSMIGGRSGNRGRCAQPCRLNYTLKDNSDRNGKTGLFSGELLSPKDMCVLDHLPDLIEAGVCSFKIEGRMKQAEYAAGVVSIYRKYLDLYERTGRKDYKVAESDRKMLLTLFNRDGFTDGYLYRHNGPEMMALKRHTLSAKEEQERAFLYENLKKEYVDRESNLSVTGEVSVLTDRVLSLTITESRTGKTVTVTGEKVLSAENRPLDRQRIYDQIMKTGGSGYRISHLQVVTDGTSFVPMALLNSLRRSAFARMNDKLLEEYMRRSDLVPDKNAYFAYRKKENLSESSKGINTILLSASVETEEQYKAVLTEETIDSVYIPYHFLSAKQTDKKLMIQKASEFAAETALHGKKLYLSMPYVERRDRNTHIGSLGADLVEKGLAGFLVRCPETMARLREEGLAQYVRLDSSVYTFNREAQKFLNAFGFSYDTIPVELNRKEIRNRDNRNSELIIYGHLPLMITAQCLRKTTKGCSGDYSRLLLKDRKGREFPVSCDCMFCYNIIRNPIVLSLISEAGFCRKAGIPRARLVFTSESKAQVENVCRITRKALLENSGEDISVEHTKGHFNRGVE